jgi:hypothetical protein
MRAMPTGSLPCTWLLPAAASSRHACWGLAQTQSEAHGCDSSCVQYLASLVAAVGGTLPSGLPD